MFKADWLHRGKRNHAVARIQEYTDYHADEVGNQLDQLGFVTKQVKGSEVRSDQQDEHTRLRSITQVAIK